jgi:hypothetical protein
VKALRLGGKPLRQWQQAIKCRQRQNKGCSPVKRLFTASDWIANLDGLALYRAVLPCETLGAQVKAFIAAEVRPCLIHLLY